MRRVRFAFIGGVLAALVLLVFLNMYVFKGVLTASVLQLRSRWAPHLFEEFSSLRTFSSALARYRSLASENASLKEENAKLTYSAALLEALRDENAVLKESLGFDADLNDLPFAGNIYSLIKTSSGYKVLVNRGSEDGVVVGDVVATPQGVLAGVISEVFLHDASVRPVIDAGFEVTARVAGSETSGFVRGDGSDKLSFELIVQADEIQEGDRIVTSGDDHMPPGFLIGSVENIQVGQVQLFKRVRIAPALTELRFADVLIFRAK